MLFTIHEDFSDRAEQSPILVHPWPSPYQSTDTASPLVTPPTSYQQYDAFLQSPLFAHGLDNYQHPPRAGPSRLGGFPYEIEHFTAVGDTFEPQPLPLCFDDNLLKDLEDMNATTVASRAQQLQQPVTPPPAPPPRAPRKRRAFHASEWDKYFRGEDKQIQRQFLDSALRSSWLKHNQLEPTSGGSQSILSQLLSSRSSSKEKYKCLFDGCTHEFERIDRGVAHIRVHLKHKPIPCSGDCPAGKRCEERFASNAYLQSHLKRSRKPCRVCGKEILPQNMGRHMKLHKELTELEPPTEQ